MMIGSKQPSQYVQAAESLDIQPIERLIVTKNKRLYYWEKRLIDIVFSLTLLILLSPLLILIAILIKLDSTGPVIFKQERIGYDWRRHAIRSFTFYKFRSMVNNADQSVHREQVKAWIRGEFYSTDGSMDKIKVANDPRITRVGRYLRMTSLDELPQLWNVLLGAMSLVGPRPVPTYEVAEYESWHYQRLIAPAGITGLWQVEGRGLVSLDDMVRMDVKYIRNQSIWLDIAILFKTIPAVLSRRGAK